MSPLAKRIISALVALLLLVGILYLGKTATYTMCVLVAGASIFEFANILFTPHKIGPITRFLFFVFGFALFLITLNDPTLLSQSLGFISLAPTIDAITNHGHR